MEREKLVSWFWSKVQVLGLEECWEWTGRLDDKGYGASRTLYDHRLSQKAHRAAFILTRGELIDPVVRHSCNNRKCCNPSHLSPGDQLDNMMDRKRSGNYPEGENHPNVFLTNQQIMSIAKDPRPSRVIAEEYGFASRASIS